MRFGGLTAIDDLSFTAVRNDITALIGPNGAGKTTVFNCITGFYKPTEGTDHSHPRRWQALPARAHGRFPHRLASQGGAHLPEHPAVRRHDGSGKPDGGPAQHADAGLGLYRRRHFQYRPLPPRQQRGGRILRLLAGEDRPRRPRRRSRRRTSLWRPAPPRNRPRHVHQARAPLPRRACRRPQPARIRGPEQAAAVDPQGAEGSPFC